MGDVSACLSSCLSLIQHAGTDRPCAHQVPAPSHTKCPPPPAVLEPYKHHARAATAALLVHKLVREGFNRRTLALATLVLLVASSQDILAAHNKGQINIQSFKSVLAPLARYRLLPQGLVVALGGAQGNTTNASAGSPPGSWGSSSSGSGSSGSSSGGSVAAARQLQQVVWQVEGMKCEGCANYLKSMLQQLPGVESCTVDFALKRVSGRRLNAGGLWHVEQLWPAQPPLSLASAPH